MVFAVGSLTQMGMTPEQFTEHWDEVLKANMAKKVATEIGQSKRGFIGDLYKPIGWVGPYHRDICKKYGFAEITVEQKEIEEEDHSSE